MLQRGTTTRDYKLLVAIKLLYYNIVYYVAMCICVVVTMVTLCTIIKKLPW